MLGLFIKAFRLLNFAGDGIFADFDFRVKVGVLLQINAVGFFLFCTAWRLFGYREHSFPNLKV